MPQIKGRNIANNNSPAMGAMNRNQIDMNSARRPTLNIMDQVKPMGSFEMSEP